MLHPEKRREMIKQIAYEEGFHDGYSQPMSEMSEIVRCKDCKHSGCRTQNVDGSIFRVVCKKHSTKRDERWMDADWFCADGETADT